MPRIKDKRSEIRDQRSGRRGKGKGERPEVVKKRAAVRALWVVVGALREAAERMEQVESDQGYILHARQLRGAAGMAEEWIRGIVGEVENSKLETQNWQEEGKIIEGRVLDEDDGYCD